jgi:hypothetical protein
MMLFMLSIFDDLSSILIKLQSPSQSLSLSPPPFVFSTVLSYVKFQKLVFSKPDLPFFANSSLERAIPPLSVASLLPDAINRFSLRHPHARQPPDAVNLPLPRPPLKLLFYEFFSVIFCVFLLGVVVYNLIQIVWASDSLSVLEILFSLFFFSS